MTDVVEFYENDGDNELLKLYNPFHSKADGRFASAGGGKGGTTKSGGLASMIKGNPTTSKPMSVKGKINSSYTGKLVGAGLIVGAGALAVGMASQIKVGPVEVTATGLDKGDTVIGKAKNNGTTTGPINVEIDKSRTAIDVKDNITGKEYSNYGDYPMTADGEQTNLRIYFNKLSEKVTKVTGE